MNKMKINWNQILNEIHGLVIFWIILIICDYSREIPLDLNSFHTKSLDYWLHSAKQSKQFSKIQWNQIYTKRRAHSKWN